MNKNALRSLMCGTIVLIASSGCHHSHGVSTDALMPPSGEWTSAASSPVQATTPTAAPAIAARGARPEAPLTPSMKRCGTPSVQAETYAAVHDDLVQSRALEPLLERFTASGFSATVRTAIHVIKTMSNEGAVTDEQLSLQFAELRARFAPFGVFLERVDDSSIQEDRWRTIQSDTATELEMMTNRKQDSSQRLAAKSQPPADLHVFICVDPQSPVDGKIESVLGYARYPWKDAFGPLDGAVIRYDTLPRGTCKGCSLGFTAVHEVGHWFGLLHTFDQGCSGLGDDVADTALENPKPNGFTCTPTRDTCPGDANYDPIHNFMTYTDDECIHELTEGQGTRIKEMITRFRKRFIHTSNSELQIGAERLKLSDKVLDVK